MWAVCESQAEQMRMRSDDSATCLLRTQDLILRRCAQVCSRHPTLCGCGCLPAEAHSRLSSARTGHCQAQGRRGSLEVLSSGTPHASASALQQQRLCVFGCMFCAQASRARALCASTQLPAAGAAAAAECNAWGGWGMQHDGFQGCTCPISQQRCCISWLHIMHWNTLTWRTCADQTPAAV